MDFPHEQFGIPLADSYSYAQDLALLRSTMSSKWSRQRRTYTHAASLVKVSFRLRTEKAFSLIQWLHNNPSWMNMMLISGNDKIESCPVHYHQVRRTSSIQSSRIKFVNEFIVSFEVETNSLVSNQSLCSSAAGAASEDYPVDLPIPVMDGFTAEHGTRNVTVYSLTYRMDTQMLKRWNQFAAFKGTAWFKSPMVSPNIPCGKEWLRYISNPEMVLIRPNLFEVTIQAESMPASYSIDGVTAPDDGPPIPPPTSGCIYDEPTIHYDENGHPYVCSPSVVPPPTNDFLLPASRFIVSASNTGLAPVTAATRLTFFANTKSIASPNAIAFTRSSIGTYFGADGKMRTAKVNEMRIDHDPVTKECLGLLIEEARANVCLHSNDFGNAVWTVASAAGTNVIQNATMAPDGTMTACKLVETATTDIHSRRQTNLPVGSQRRFSVYAKAAERTEFRGWSFAGGNTNQHSFDLVNGTCSGPLNPLIEKSVDGWYRCSYDLPAPHATISIGPSDGTALTAAYPGVDGSGIYLWGAQVEVGAYATSYIPTTNAAITRQVDNLTVSNLSHIGFNNSEGTLFADFSYISDSVLNSSNRCAWALSDGTTNNRMFVYNGSEAAKYYSIANNANDVAITTGVGSVQAGIKVKSANTYKLNDYAVSVNGLSAIVDSGAAVPVVDRLNIGSGHTVGTSPLSGHIKHLSYYPQRLSNADLQTLTSGSSIAAQPSFVLDASAAPEVEASIGFADSINPAWTSWYKLTVPDVLIKPLWIHIPSGIEYSVNDGSGNWLVSTGVDVQLNGQYSFVSTRYQHTASVTESVSSPPFVFQFKQNDAQGNKEVVGTFDVINNVTIIVEPVVPPTSPFIQDFGTAGSAVRTPWYEEAMASVRITNWNNSEFKGALIGDSVLVLGDPVTQNVTYWVDPTLVGGAGNYTIEISNVVGGMQPAAGTYNLPFDFSEVQFTLSAIGNSPTQGVLNTSTAVVKIYKNGTLVSQGSISLRADSRGVIT